MRGIAVGAMVGAAVALFAAAPAGARERALTAGLTSTGAVSVTWHGERALGCAAAGLCGYRGSVSTQPGTDGELVLTLGRHGVVDAFGFLDQQAPSVVRVQRRETSGSTEACVDALPPGEVDVIAQPPRNGATRIGLAGAGLDAGRCAGPDLTNALLRIPERRLSLARLRRGATTIDLSARLPLRSGPFSGLLVSTVRLHVGRMQRATDIIDEQAPGPSRGRRFARVVNLHAVYRVTGMAGKLAASFDGLAAPACSGVDACGLSGVANWAILSSGGTVVIDARALARGSDHGLRGLLAAVKRRGSRGFVASGADLRHEAGITTASVDRSGGESCHDSRSALPPYVSMPTTRTGTRVELGEPDVYPGSPNLLRTGCPGPTQAAVVGRHVIASGWLPLAAVARRRIDLPLGAGGRFDDGAYRGVWRSRFDLRLRRVEERLTYSFRRVSR
jgi:hypothetical protein